MDTLFTRLEEAAKTGDVNLLKELLKNDNLLLEKVIGATSVRDNPLHISAMLGHADFVREVLYLKPELAKELNGEGLSPLHLAAAHDHVTVMKELLKVIKFLLSKAAIDVNTMNLASFTPLDVLLGSWPQNEDLFLGEMIRAAGGKTAAEVLSKSEPDVIRDSISSNSASRILAPRTSLWQPHCLCTNNDIEEATLEFHKEKKEKEYNPQILLLVAMLVATVTFQAALNPPGGFNLII
ncbi:Ankyrin repeat-containing protein [Carex littledalei]|uniref:Ankyrin repeat-containing protein n=1 Tax=Carex littledalei TaxID=544730 RepID=A0A833RJD1_9POAL|nr:Ankyrin repeat-containing protein [Carex littledalei]